MGRKKAFGWRWRIAAILLLGVLAGLGYAWWQAQHWTPPREDYPTQGVLIGADDGEVDFAALAAVGANFAYVEASSGESGRDAYLGPNLRGLSAGNLPYGVVHHYDPCISAERQAANFVTIVPRGAGTLPPVIALKRLANDCDERMLEAAVESELTTFLNQIEGHAEQAAILMLEPEFQAEYAIASRIDRTLWLTDPFIEPTYAGRPWTLWTANDRLSTEGASRPVRWVVAQP